MEGQKKKEKPGGAGKQFHPDVVDRAYDQYMKGLSPGQILDDLVDHFSGKKEGIPWRKVPGDVTTIFRWMKKWDETGRKEQDALESPPLEDYDPGESFTLEVPPAVSEQLQEGLPPVPGIDDLLEQGVPENKAPYIVAEWDAALRGGDADAIAVCQKIVALHAENPDIPPDKADAIAALEAKEDKYGIPESQRLSVLAKRYKPWKGGSYQAAFRKMAQQLTDQLNTRKKSRQPGLMDRLLGRGKKPSSGQGHGEPDAPDKRAGRSPAPEGGSHND